MYQVHLDISKSYDIYIGSGLIEKAGAFLSGIFPRCRIAVITDSNVYPLYAEKLGKSLTENGYEYDTFVFPAGEQSKNLSTLSDILEFMADHQLTRSDFVIALGGGVTGDMAGFAAAVYARGIRFVQIPTTLLAAVDSSVGGKTAVDLKAGKNLAGAFHQPSLVLTDTDVIAALPAHLLSEGAAEVIKYGVLEDTELFDWMCSETWKEKLPEIILRSVKIKQKFVSEDEFDTGVRKLLNLGHTFGHAIEKCADFSLSHGFGVAIGMAIAAGAAGKKDVCAKIIQANTTCHLPSSCDYSPVELAHAALTDKKRSGDYVDLVMPQCIGHCVLEKTPVEQLSSLFEKGLAAVKELT